MLFRPLHADLNLVRSSVTVVEVSRIALCS